jgi:Raf kinase inhibitor-like YbhB/YbcL family protein
VGARTKILFAAALLAGFLAAGHAADPTIKGATMKIQLKSTAFAEGQPIPSRYAYDNEDISPDLQWSGAPSTAKSLALICDDPDAPMGTWVHWVLYDLAPSMTGIPEGMPKSTTLDSGAKQGMNDYKKTGYGGPCPPPGKPHRYFFKLYALDAKLDLKPGLTKQDLLKALGGHIIAEGELMGTYQRK